MLSEYELVHSLTKKRISNKKTIFNIDELRLIKKVYRDISGGKTWKGCSSCWQELYLKTSPETLTNNFIQMNNRKFHLQAGKQINLHGVPTVYTDKNLTDEAAIMILKVSRGHIKFFASYPENWEEIVANYVLGKAQEVADDEQVVIGKKAKRDAQKEKESQEGGDGGDSSNDVDLSKMTKKELQGFAASKELPEAEWTKLGRDKLQVYLEANLK